MNLQPILSEFPDTVYEENFVFFFISVQRWFFLLKNMFAATISRELKLRSSLPKSPEDSICKNTIKMYISAKFAGLVCLQHQHNLNVQKVTT
jgi:hypothetical protein